MVRRTSRRRPGAEPGQHVGAERGGVDSEQVGQRVDDRRRAGDRRRRRRARRPDAVSASTARRKPRCWRSTMCCGSAAPGWPVVSSTTSAVSAQARASTRRRAAGEALTQPASAAKAGRDRLLDRVRPVLDPQPRVVAPGPGAAAIQPMPDRLDAEPGEVVQPLGVPLAVVRRAGQPGVGQPELDVARAPPAPRAARRAASSPEPARPRRPAARPRADRPGAPSCPGSGSVPPGFRCVGRASGPGAPSARRRRSRSPGRPAAASPVRGGDITYGGFVVIRSKRRSAYGLVERAVRASSASTPLRAQGERGQLEGARVDVGGGDRVRVAGQVQGLHAAAGAEIERRADRPPDGELGQRAGRRRQPEHEVGPHRRRRGCPGPGVRSENTQKSAVVGGVRAQVHLALVPARGGRRAGPRPISGSSRPGSAASRPPRLGRLLQRPQPDQGGERVVATGQRPARRGPCDCGRVRRARPVRSPRARHRRCSRRASRLCRRSASRAASSAEGSSEGTSPCWHSGPMKVALITIRAVPSARNEDSLACMTSPAPSVGDPSWPGSALWPSPPWSVATPAPAVPAPRRQPVGRGHLQLHRRARQGRRVRPARHRRGRPEQRRRDLARLRLSGGRGVRRAEADRRQAQLSGGLPGSQQDHRAGRRVRAVRRGEVRGHEPAGADRPDVRAGQALVPARGPAGEGRRPSPPPSPWRCSTWACCRSSRTSTRWRPSSGPTSPPRGDRRQGRLRGRGGQGQGGGRGQAGPDRARHQPLGRQGLDRQRRRRRPTSLPGRPWASRSWTQGVGAVDCTSTRSATSRSTSSAAT